MGCWSSFINLWFFDNLIGWNPEKSTYKTSSKEYIFLKNDIYKTSLLNIYASVCTQVKGVSNLLQRFWSIAGSICVLHLKWLVAHNHCLTIEGQRELLHFYILNHDYNFHHHCYFKKYQESFLNAGRVILYVEHKVIWLLYLESLCQVIL